MPYPNLEVWKLRSFAEAERAGRELWALYGAIPSWEKASLKPGATVPGYSVTAEALVEFILHWDADGPQWRESLICPVTALSSRVRAAYHALRSEVALSSDAAIYLTENTTPFFRFMSARYRETVGSEFLVDVPNGTLRPDGVRSEDLTCLTFPSQTFDAIFCLEVLEHVPDYKSALSQMHRVLKPGGALVLTAPFTWRARNLKRAFVDDLGCIVHIEEPEYHGDPISEDPVLCYWHFGFELLDDLRFAGFSDAYVGAYHSETFGYIGSVQAVIVATK